ncbi:MAG: TolC family protein [Candidatus Zixiibacteriota bacterium]|nr:MAG: TolC family protein [candidate division Zixibacteria bacterium]
MKRGIAITLATSFLIIFGINSGLNAETYTLDQCIDIALKNNYGVIAAEKAYSTARGNVYAAYGSLLPNISISSGMSRTWSGSLTWDEISKQFVAGGETRYGYRGSLNFSNTFIGLGLYNYGDIKYSRSIRTSSFYDYVKSQNDLILEVKRGYYDLIKAKMLLDVARDAVRRGEERLRVVQSRYDLGSASMSDVLKAKVQYGNDKLDLVSKNNAYKLAQANLAFIMGIDVNKEFDADENLPERDIDITFEGAINEALSKNPEYRKSQFDLSAARYSKTMAYSRFLPSLSLGLSHYTTVDNYADYLDFSIGGASYTLFATLNFNIFNQATDYARLKSAKNSQKTAEENLKNTQNSVALEIKRSFLELERAKEAKKLAEESVAAAQEDLNLVKEKYNLGAATILEVLDAEVSFKEAQTNHVQALFDYNLAVSQLEKALGR